MSLLVGWHYSGQVAVYDEQTDETVIHSISKVRLPFGSDKSVNALNQLCNIVNPNQVKRLVFVCGQFCMYQCRMLIHSIKSRGFVKVNLSYLPSNRLQTLLLNKNISLKEGEYCAAFVIHGCNTVDIWRFQGNRLTFIKSLRDSVDVLCRAIKVLNIQTAFTQFCPDITELFNREFPNVTIVSADTLTKDDFVRAALWTAKKMDDDTIPGFVVANVMRLSMSIVSNGEVVFKHDGYCAVPFIWHSSWLFPKTAFDFTLSDTEISDKVQLPIKQCSRVCFRVSSEGYYRFCIEQKLPMVIYLRNDCFDVGYGNSEVAGPFPSILKFDSDNELKLTTVTSGSNIITDAFRMLDARASVSDNWIAIHYFDDQTDYGKLIKSQNDNTEHVVSAVFAVSRLLQLAVAKIKVNSFVEGQPVHIVVPSSFTDGQRNGLLRAAKLTGMTLFVVDELLALANGFAAEKKMTEKQCVLIVNLKVEGCEFLLAEVTGMATKECERVRLDSLRSEEVREAARMLDSEQPSLNLTKDALKMRRQKISEFQDAVKTVLRDRQHDVKEVLLTGSCHLVPMISELLQWTFLSVEIATIDNKQFRQFVLLGGSMST